jgi:very-short-patch-repair endonuclease
MRHDKWDRGELARELRRGMTVPEIKLWGWLRGRRVRGAKFRRQHPIGPFIADFYCAEVGLVVELDGGMHDDRTDLLQWGRG